MNINPFLHSYDLNIEILSHLDDHTLASLCESNNYFSVLCHDPLLWKLKINYKYNGFPIIEGFSYEFYKNLYNKLKRRKYMDLIVWAKFMGYDDIIDWLSTYHESKHYFQNGIKK